MNNKYDEIDNLLFKYFENNQEVPENIINCINTAIKSKNKQYRVTLLIRKIVITILSLLTITGSVVFATDIKNFVYILKENIFGTYNNGITTAIENGYEAEIDMDYVESNGIEVKVDSFFIDDYNLNMLFNVKINNNDYMKKVKVSKISIRDLLILDENNNILYTDYEKTEEFDKYCKDNNLNVGDLGNGYSDGSLIEKTKYIQKNNFINTFNTSSEKFPAVEKIYITLKKIYLLNDRAHVIDDVYRLTTFGFKKANKKDFCLINGNWKLEINLDEVINKRKNIEYVVDSINDDNTIIQVANLSTANMRLELITNSNKIDFEKLKNKENINVTDIIPFHDIYIETSSGKKFFQSTNTSNGYNSLEDGKIKYYTTFDYTYFDKEENIKIILPTNKNEEIIIELKYKNLEAQQ